MIAIMLGTFPPLCLFSKVTHSYYHAGSRPISPFGVFGIFLRSRFQRSIRDQFPQMIDDIAEHSHKQRGMAAYVNEVAIDTGLIISKNPSAFASNNDGTQNRVSVVGPSGPDPTLQSSGGEAGEAHRLLSTSY